MELQSSPGDHVSLLLKVKGPVSLLSSFLASAVAISTVFFDQMALLHLILGSGASPQENVISVFSSVSWTVLNSNSRVSRPSSASYPIPSTNGSMTTLIPLVLKLSESVHGSFKNERKKAKWQCGQWAIVWSTSFHCIWSELHSSCGACLSLSEEFLTSDPLLGSSLFSELILGLCSVALPSSDHKHMQASVLVHLLSNPDLDKPGSTVSPASLWARACS